MNTLQLHKKICLLGTFGVGKTSLVRRFVYDKYDDEYKSTIGAKVSQKRLVPLENSRKELIQFNFLVWDIEGVEKATPQVNHYLLGAHGFLLIGDLTREETIGALPAISEFARKIAPGAPLVLAGNKADLAPDGSHTAAVLAEVADRFSAPYLLTSVKDGRNVEDCFTQLGLLIAE